MRDFHMSEHAAERYPLKRAFALLAWHNETNPWCAVERVGDGYIAQEAFERRKNEE